MSERGDIVTLMGKPATLIGTAVYAGERAPEAVLSDLELQDVPLSRYGNAIRVLNVVPSLDTPVCDLQTQRFNTQAQQWGDRVRVLTVSVDLPFAQKRWCGAHGAENIVPLSDYRHREFGAKYGLLIRETGFLARAVMVVDPTGIIRHLEIVPEVADHPNYDAARSVVEAQLSATS